MIGTLITLIVLLICFVFVKSTIFTPSSYRNKDEAKPAKVNILIATVCAILAFIPIVKWIVLPTVPLMTVIWYFTDGFDNSGDWSLKLDDKTTMSKILLYKI